MTELPASPIVVLGIAISLGKERRGRDFLNASDEVTPAASTGALPHALPQMDG